MDWQRLWLPYLLLFVTVVLFVGMNLRYWKRDPHWRWWREGLVSLGIVGLVFAILLPVMTPRPDWYARNDVLAITFSPDGRLLAFQTRNGDVTLRDANTGQHVRHFQMAVAPPAWPRPAYATEIARWDFRHSVVFSPDSRLLAAGWLDNGVRVWNTATGALEQEMDAEVSAQPLAFSPGGQRLLAGDYIGHINTWDLSSYARIIHSTTASPVREGPADMAFAPNGRLTVITATEVQQWDPDGWRKLRAEPRRSPSGKEVVPPYWHDTCAFSPDGRWLALQTRGGERPEILLWDTLTWKEAARITLPEGSGETGLPYTNPAAVSPDGRTLAIGDEQRIVLVDAHTGSEVRSFPATGFYPLCFAFSPDGARLAVGGDDGRVTALPLGAR